jgi:hypothetical protein
MSHVLMTAMMNEPGLLDMIETFPGSEFNYELGGLAAIQEKNVFAVPSYALGVEDESAPTGSAWPQDGFASPSHKRFWMEKETRHDEVYESRRHELDSNVFVNGTLIGRVSGLNVEVFVNRMRTMRRRLDLPIDTSIAWIPEAKEIYIVCEAGILRRPLFILDTRIEDPEERMRDLVLRLERVWNSFGRRSCAGLYREMLAQGIVEYLDKMEEQNCLVKADCSVPDIDATSERAIMRPYTHCVLGAVL